MSLVSRHSGTANGSRINSGGPLFDYAIPHEPWMERANCLGTDPEAFFPDKGGSTREAKSICKRCEVSAECLDAAIDREERFGIFGGKSERQRRKIKRDRDDAAATHQDPTTSEETAS